MKKILGVIMSVALLAGSAAPAWAQGSARRYNTGRAAEQRRYDSTRRVYNDYDGRYEDDRSVWEKSRDKITVAGGAGAGAVIGGLVGGKKGAIIGAIIGGGGSALYTYKVRDRDNDDRRYR